MKKIAIVAGEVSGDILGARLILSLKKHYPNLMIEGIGGAEMEQAGCDCLYPMERLSVMGFAEVLSRLFELLKIRKQLIKHWTASPPDVFIGIDAPDFNLALEASLHKTGVSTVHYVSPSVWAWREKRVKKMVGNIDLMLTLFPFEVQFYKRHQINAQFVGHPLADEIPLSAQQKPAREQLALPLDKKIMAILPGSRSGEIKRLSKPFLRAAMLLQKQYPDLLLIAPMANSKTYSQFEAIKAEIAPKLALKLIDGQSRLAMQAADIVLLASGTAVLEGMLLNRPMVAAYKLSAITITIIRFFKMFKVNYFTLPNNLANERLVPELLQEQVTPENILTEINALLNETDKASYRQQRFLEIHKQLKQNASEAAARAIISFNISNF